jgi:hypothetical protein
MKLGVEPGALARVLWLLVHYSRQCMQILLLGHWQKNKHPGEGARLHAGSKEFRLAIDQPSLDQLRFGR